MSNEHQNSVCFLEEIPFSLRTPEHVPAWQHGKASLTHRIARDPVNLQELNQYPYSVAIYRDNGTLTYVTPSGSDDLPDPNRRYLFLEFRDNRKRTLQLSITGVTDEAVADTLDYFIGLQENEATAEYSHLLMENGPVLGNSLVLGIHDENAVFDFRNARFECLSRLFTMAPEIVEFYKVKLSAEQTISLATIPYPIHKVHFWGCQFEDSGTAFVSALENRQSSFGILHFIENTPLDDGNLRRLIEISKIECLQLPRLNDKQALLPFAAKADTLMYHIASSSLSEAALKSLTIVPDKLVLCIVHENGEFPTDEVLYFFRRASALGHFTTLAFEFPFLTSDLDIPEGVVQGLIEVARANHDLEFIGLKGSDEQPQWENVVRPLFEGIKNHKSLCSIQLNVANESFGPDFDYLRQLLSHNKKIEVFSSCGQIYSDGASIDELYSLNRFYCRSKDLEKAPPPERPSLVATALVKRRVKGFRRTAMLLLHHVDALRELVQFAEINALEHDSPPERQQREPNPPAKRQRSQPPRAVKRTSNSST